MMTNTHLNSIFRGLLTVILLFAFNHSHAALIASDTFEGYSAGNLNGNGGGTGWGGNWTGVGGPSIKSIISTASSPLNFTSANSEVMFGGQRALAFGGNNNEAARRILSTNISDDVVYVSMLVRYSGTQNDHDFLALWLGTSDWTLAPNVGVKMNRGNSSGTEDIFARSVGGSETYSTNITSNTTYLVVAKFEKTVTGASNPYNRVTLWVNPTSLASEPVSTLVSTTNSSVSSFSQIGFRTVNLDTDDTITIDNLYIGTSWDDVMAYIGPASVDYRFDETSWSDTAGDVVDSSPNTNHATPYNGATTTTGVLCNAGSFDGNNDYIEIPHIAEQNGSNELTYVAWVRPDAWSGVMQVMAKSVHGGGSGRNQMGIFSESNILKGRAETLSDRREVTTTLPSTGSWTQVVLVYSGTSLKFYTNGVLQATDTFSNRNLRQTSDPMTVSKRYPNATYFLDGLIDEMLVFDQALTDTDVSAIYQNILSGNNWDGSTRTCAITPTSQNLILSTNNSETLGGLSFTDGSLVSYDAALDSASLYFDEANFSSSEDIDAIHVLANGNLILSTTGNATLGGISFENGDLVSYDPNSNTATLYFDENNFSGNEDIDAVYVRDNGNILLSTDGSATLGGLSFNDGDIVEYVPSTNTATLFFDGNIFSANGNVDALHLLDNGNLLMSTAGTSTIGGNSYSDGSVFEFNPSANTATSYFDESLFSNGADINAISFPQTTATLDHIEITHSGSALTCEPTTISIRGCTSTTDCSVPYTNDINVTLSPNNTTLSPNGWAAGDVQTLTGGSGSLDLQVTSAQTINLGFSSSAPSASNTTAQCINTGLSDTTCSLVFYDTGFTYNIPTQTSCATSSAVTINAVRLDNTTLACVPTFVNQSRNVVFNMSYVTPNAGTQGTTLNYSGTNYTPITNATSQTVPINFNASGQATFTLTYPDAGQVSLNSQYTGSVGTGDDGLNMQGSTTYVTKPYKLYVSSADSNASCASNDSSCSSFTSAGSNFNLSVRGACQDNSVTPNFQLSNIGLSHSNTAPAIAQGSLGISTVDITSNGSATISNQTVSEVGVFRFTATPPTYFGETIGSATLNQSDYIGRFTPSHFCINSPTLSNRTDSDTASSCTDSFTYLDEQFSLSIPMTAQAAGTNCNAAGITQNYTGTFTKFTTPYADNTSNGTETGKWNFAAIDGPGTTNTDLSTRLVIDSANSSGSFTNGQATLSAVFDINRAGSAPTYTAETAYSNTHIGMNPIDSDNITSISNSLAINGINYFDLANSSFYFGRLYAENAFGTSDVNLGLDMHARTEYCNAVTSGACTDWQIKTDDSCSLYNIAAPTNTALGGVIASDGDGYYQRASATVTSSVFNYLDDGSAASYARVHVADTLNHHAGWRLFYTGGGDGGDFLIPFLFPFNADTSVHPYLLHINGTASFGQFRGDDRIIYWREILQ